MEIILVPIDFSDVTPTIIGTVTAFVRSKEAKVYLLHIAPPEPEFIGYEPGPQTVRDAVAKEFHEEHRKLQLIEHQLQEGGAETTALLVQGATVPKILEEAERLNADLIIMGSHGHSALYDLIVGSVTEGVLRKASCPVLVIPSQRKT